VYVSAEPMLLEHARLSKKNKASVASSLDGFCSSEEDTVPSVEGLLGSLPTKHDSKA
jgi:hypothetical protein